MISLHLHPDNCREYKAWSEYMKTQTESAVAEIDELTIERSVMEWFSPTKRNLFRQSSRKGYQSYELSWPERTPYLQDIFEINTSKSIRQGKSLEEAYKQRPVEITGGKTCEHHYGTFIGCFAPSGKLVAYITTNFCGELAAASQIIGRAEYLRDGIMVNIWHEFVRICIDRGIKAIVYSRWEDGFEGLKAWKKSVGMRAEVLKEIL